MSNGKRPTVSMSSAAGSRAKTLASPAKVPASMVRRAAYGASSIAPFARFDPATLSWRTFQRCLAGGWMSFSAIWPAAGMTRSGDAFQQPPWVLHTSGKGSGLLHIPTPTANNANDNAHHVNRTDKAKGHKGVNLIDFIRLYPTVRAAEWKGVGPIGSRSHKSRLRKRYLDATVQELEQNTGTLNPEWVEWLQGFPATWTALDVSVIASSRKSRK